jgi:hypothetical protein
LDSGIGIGLGIEGIQSGNPIVQSPNPQSNYQMTQLPDNQIEYQLTPVAQSLSDQKGLLAI